MKQMQMHEFRIGVFVSLAIGILLYALIRLDAVSFEDKNLVHITFDYAGGLESGAAVKFAGVRVGEVKSIQILTEDGKLPKVDVAAMLDPDIKINQDAEFRISSRGLLGTKYIEITPGQSKELITGSESFKGINPVLMDRMIGSAENIALKLDGLMSNLDELFNDSEFRESIKNNVDDFSHLIQEVRLTSANLNYILTEVRNGNGLMGKLMTDETIYNDLKELVADLKRNPWKLLKKR